MKRTPLVAILVLVACGGGKSDKLSSDDKKEIRAVQDEALKLVDKLAADRLAGIKAAAAKAGPVMGSKEPCPLDLQGQIDKLEEYLRLPEERKRNHHPMPFDVTSVADLEKTVEDHKTKKMRSRILRKRTSMSNAKAATKDKFLSHAKQHTDPAHWGFRAAIIADKRIDAKVTSDVGPGKAGKMIPGSLMGRMFVWDYAKGAVVCVAPVFATNSANVKVRYSKKDDKTSISGLTQDLDHQAFRAAVPKAVAVGDASVPYPVTITQLPGPPATDDPPPTTDNR
jgi:hypothetical protein